MFQNCDRCFVLLATRDRWEMLTSLSLPSVRRQTRQPDLLVLVNDGRPLTNPQQQYLADLVAPIPLSVLKNRRLRGAAGAWNTGLAFLAERHGRGFVALLDDDDTWDPNHLETNLAAAAEGADIVISGLRLLIDGAEQERELVRHVTDREFLVGNPGWQGSNTFVRLSLLKQVGGFREGMPSLNDRDLAIRLLRVPGVRVAFTGAWTSSWHIRTGSASLSSPRSPAKVAGLQWFWRIYGQDMTAAEAEAFLARAERLFAVPRQQILRHDTEGPTHCQLQGDLVAS
ncbi:MAG: glycosyltransferase family 2 protein [Phycisphaeraceae bacterium]